MSFEIIEEEHTPPPYRICITFDDPAIINLVLNRYPSKTIYFMGGPISLPADPNSKTAIEAKSIQSRLCWNVIPKVTHERDLWDYIFQVLDDFFDQYECDVMYLYTITFICSYEVPSVKLRGSGVDNSSFKLKLGTPHE